jgi:beta-lactamase class A
MSEKELLSALKSGDEKENWFQRNIGGLLRPNSQWSIFFKNLETGWSCGINNDVSMDTMSVIKIPLLLRFIELAFEGEFNLDQKVVITRGNKRFGTGILSSMDDGIAVSLRDLAFLMITLSDNTATDIIYESIGGPKELNDSMSRIGLSEIKACGTSFDWFKSMAISMDPKAISYDPEELFVKGYGINDPEELFLARSKFHFEGKTRFGLATTKEISILLEMIANGQYANQKVCDEAMRILGLQKQNSRIPRYLPSTALVYHKTGDFNPFIANDVGIVIDSSGQSFVLSIFSSNNKEPWGSIEEVASQIAQQCYENLHVLA